MSQGRQTHPVVLRVTHWVGAAATLCMILSGWAIYNASPILPFVFPSRWTLGGWLAAGLAWHFAAMWVLVADLLVYLVWGAASGHFRRDLFPISLGAGWRDLRAALAFRLGHRIGEYNAVQKSFYVGIGIAGALLVLTGFSIWKPVQLAPLTWVFGGYDLARRLHFALMVAVVLFLLVHVALVAIVPETLKAMIVGHREPERVR